MRELKSNFGLSALRKHGFMANWAWLYLVCLGNNLCCWLQALGATVPTCRSGGTSGWKSSATGDSEGLVGSETALDAALSNGPSVIPGPLPIPSPVGCCGCLRPKGSRTGCPARVDEFLCSEYVTIPERNR